MDCLFLIRTDDSGLKQGIRPSQKQSSKLKILFTTSSKPANQRAHFLLLEQQRSEHIDIRSRALL
jgi:hypothetical protein